MKRFIIGWVVGGTALALVLGRLLKGLGEALEALDGWEGGE